MRLRRRHAMVGGAMVIAGLGWAGGSSTVTTLVGSPQHGCVDDSRYVHSWTHGDPAVGVPTSPAGNNGYYYLNVFACGTSVEGAIWTDNGRWRIDIDDGYNHANPLAQQVATTPFSLTYTGVHPGQFIRIRFANESGMVKPDHASAYGSDTCALVGSPNDTSVVPSNATCGPDPNTITNQFTAGGGGGSTQPPVVSPPAPSAPPTAAPTPRPTPSPLPPPTPRPSPPPTSSPPVPTSCPTTTSTHTGTVSGRSAYWFYPAGSNTLCATLTWSGPERLSLVIYTSDSQEITETSVGSGESLVLAVTPGTVYKVKARVSDGSSTDGFTLSVSY